MILFTFNHIDNSFCNLYHSPLKGTRKGRSLKIEKRKKIIILTVDVGGGHKAPAIAIKNQIDKFKAATKDRKDTIFEVEVVDFGNAIKSKFLYPMYKNFWIHIALKYPPIIKAFFSTADNSVAVRSIDNIFGFVLIPRFKRYLEKEKPDLVVSTYFTPHHYLESLKFWKGKHFKSVGINPEPFQSHSIWVAKKLDYCIVFSQEAKVEMEKKGTDSRKIHVFNYPVRPEFSEKKCNKKSMREKLGIEINMMTCLFNFGAEGVGPTLRYLKIIEERNLPIQIIIICGRNKKLKEQLDKRAYDIHSKTNGKTRVIVHGFVNNMEDYICASDFTIGKAGPNSIFESIIVGRPPVIVSFMENERATMEWIIKNKLGWLKRDMRSFIKFIQNNLQNNNEILEYTANIEQFGYKSGTPEIANFLLSIC